MLYNTQFVNRIIGAGVLLLQLLIPVAFIFIFHSHLFLQYLGYLFYFIMSHYPFPYYLYIH